MVLRRSWKMDGPPARLALLARTAGNIVCEHNPRNDVLLHLPYGVLGNTVAERTTVARSALHPWQPASSPTSLALRRGTLHCASCWHPRSASEAEPPVHRAATFTLPGVVRTTVARSALRRWEPVNEKRRPQASAPGAERGHVRLDVRLAVRSGCCRARSPFRCAAAAMRRGPAEERTTPSRVQRDTRGSRQTCAPHWPCVAAPCCVQAAGPREATLKQSDRSRVPQLTPCRRRSKRLAPVQRNPCGSRSTRSPHWLCFAAPCERPATWTLLARDPQH